MLMLRRRASCTPELAVSKTGKHDMRPQRTLVELVQGPTLLLGKTGGILSRGLALKPTPSGVRRSGATETSVVQAMNAEVHPKLPAMPAKRARSEKRTANQNSSSSDPRWRFGRKGHFNKAVRSREMYIPHRVPDYSVDRGLADKTPGTPTQS